MAWVNFDGQQLAHSLSRAWDNSEDTRSGRAQVLEDFVEIILEALDTWDDQTVDKLLYHRVKQRLSKYDADPS